MVFVRPSKAAPFSFSLTKSQRPAPAFEHHPARKDASSQLCWPSESSPRPSMAKQAPLFSPRHRRRRRTLLPPDDVQLCGNATCCGVVGRSRCWARNATKPAVRMVLIPLLNHVVKKREISNAALPDLVAVVHGGVPVQFYVRNCVCLTEIDELTGTVVVGPDIPHNNTQAVKVQDVSTHLGEHLEREGATSVVGEVFLDDGPYGAAPSGVLATPIIEAELGKVLFLILSGEYIAVAAHRENLTAYLLEAAVCPAFAVEGVVLAQDIMDTDQALAQSLWLYHLGVVETENPSHVSNTSNKPKPKWRLRAPLGNDITYHLEGVDRTINYDTKDFGIEAAAHVLQERDVAFGIVAELERPQVGSSKPGQWAHGLYGQARKNAKLQRSMGALHQLIVHRGLMGSPLFSSMPIVSRSCVWLVCESRFAKKMRFWAAASRHVGTSTFLDKIFVPFASLFSSLFSSLLFSCPMSLR